MDLLCSQPWGFGHPTSGCPEQSQPRMWWCPSIQCSPPMLQGALLTVAVAGKVPCLSAGRECLMVSSLCSLPCSGFLPAHPDVLGERRRLSSLHQRRVRQRKAPAAAGRERLRAAGTLLRCPAHGQAEHPARAEVSQPWGSWQWLLALLPGDGPRDRRSPACAGSAAACAGHSPWELSRG